MPSRLIAIIALLLTFAGCSRTNRVRILYWNIQNRMWADQGNNYDSFVSYVREKRHFCTHAAARFSEALHDLHYLSTFFVFRPVPSLVTSTDICR